MSDLLSADYDPPTLWTICPGDRPCGVRRDIDTVDSGHDAGDAWMFFLVRDGHANHTSIVEYTDRNQVDRDDARRRVTAHLDDEKAPLFLSVPRNGGDARPDYE